nr:hypothetical protein CFP56_09462 [Quercus suber]
MSYVSVSLDLTLSPQTTFPDCGNVPQTGYWCPLVDGEENYTGLGITNPIGINATTGVIWTRPTYNKSTSLSPGAGLATVTFDAFGVPRCNRPFGSWSPDIPLLGLRALIYICVREHMGC